MGAGYEISSQLIFDERFLFLTGVFLIILLLTLLISVIAMWKIFVKAGKQGWEAIIPFYNIIIMFQITKTPMWLVLLTLIPVINFLAFPIVSIILAINLAKAFGKDASYSILIFFVIGYLMLAFDNSKYVYETP